jgi:hemicentin
MWDYGALGEQQERDYIHAKMKIFNKSSGNADIANLTDLIVLSQNLMRKYALDQLKKTGLSESDAHACSRSCVSQRDIQRVFTFYEWLMKMYNKFKPHGKFVDYSTRAIVVSLGLVYYVRLDAEHRKSYENELNHKATPTRVSFSKCFDEELKWYINKIDLPLGIAKTIALKENLFASIVCTMTHTPLIIVGSPGSSKTLSFNLTLANLKGQESKVAEFRKTDIFKALDPQFYQCSRRTTSNEIQTVFSRAINRQRSHQRVPLPVYCVVFMDEAGLPEERHESLKVLHYYLDSQEVSFVAISNHVLDAAKTNRAVSLFRPEAPRNDLETLARGCLCPTPEKPPPELKKDMDIVASFCLAYEAIMKDSRFSSFFGLRDFIHFISYLRRRRMEMLSPQLIMEAVERNFNGVSKEDFNSICKLFLRVVRNIHNLSVTVAVKKILPFSLPVYPFARCATPVPVPPFVPRYRTGWQTDCYIRWSSVACRWQPVS